MRDHSPLSPEERRKRLATMRAAFGTDVEEKLKPRLTPWEVVKRVAIGVYNDGFIHAGNLAYLSIVALFPFFIVSAAVAHLLGQSQDAMLTVTNVLRRLPPQVASTLREPIQEVLTVRTGTLLWLGGIVGLWVQGAADLRLRDCSFGPQDPAFWFENGNARAVVAVVNIFQLPAMNGRLMGSFGQDALLVSERRHARQRATAKELEGGAATRRDMGDAIGHACFLDCRDRIATADDRRAFD